MSLIPLLFILLLSASTKAGLSASSKCFCAPSRPCWPSTSDLTAFAKRLSSPSVLIQVHPSAYTCHDPHYDAAACNIAKSSQTNTVWIANQPGSMDSIEFETNIFGNSTTPACDFNAAELTLCGQGSVPPFGVNVTSENDIVQSLKFANKHNLRVVMKNSGCVPSLQYGARELILYSYAATIS